MTEQQQNTGTPAAAEGAEGATAGQPLDNRLTRIEQTQEQQGGILQRIEQALRGRGADPPPSSSTAAAGPAPGPSIAQQIAEGVHMIEQRREAGARQTAEQQAAEARLQRIEQRLPSHRPQPPMTGFKRKLQRFLVGRPDEQ